jgi:hypothetical protein
MGLNDHQILRLENDLSDVLFKAFPDEESLGVMVKRSLETQLNTIKQNAQTYEATVDKVVEYARSTGKLVQLMIGALQRNPGNQNLRKFSEDNLQKLLLVGGTTLLSDVSLASLIQTIQLITGSKEFEEIVLPACIQTLPDIDVNVPDLKDRLCNDTLSDIAKWLILLDLFLNNWERNDDGHMYIVLFVQNLEFRAKGKANTALKQWLDELPAAICPTSKVAAVEMYSERPSEESLKNLKAYFLITVEPLETIAPSEIPESDKYGVNAYVVTRLGNEDRFTRIENIGLQVTITNNVEQLQQEPYYTFEEINNFLPDWIVKANELIENRGILIQKNYRLELPPVADLTVEFWLPFEHLSASTETWKIYGQPTRLKQRNLIIGEEYSVIVRSYDRFADSSAFNNLNRTWQDSSSLNNHHIDCWDHWGPLQQQIQKSCLSLSLTCPVCAQDFQQQREKLFAWMLKQGVPIVLWSRSVEHTDEQIAKLKQKMQGMLTADIINQLEHFFEQIKQARADTLDPNKLALWCDEPKRLIELKNFREKGRLRA